MSAVALEYLTTREADAKKLIGELLAVRKQVVPNVVVCELKYVHVQLLTTVIDGYGYTVTNTYYKTFEMFKSLEDVLEYILRKWW